ncbi:Choline dehydrogenase, mitochondrial [Leucoagaricus sp. SymC.cos]|nr:Choline dehydrogenase, mitochondrial [Leucoagaricus sp. SymC.cos]
MLKNLALILVLSSLGLCATYSSINDVPKHHWDFIIVGGGTAGSVLAGRLTEDPRFNVLVIEAGPNNEKVLDSLVPGLQGRLPHSPYDWNFTTVPVKGLNGRSVDYPRGHLLGGSSAINGMVYTRGAASDYDRWAKVTGDPGWGWNRLQPYLKKQEKFEQPSDNHSIAGEFDPAVHSLTGTLPVSIPGFPHPSSDAVTLKVTEQLGGEFKFNLDWNSGHPLGIGWLQATIGHDGTRSTAATAYLNTHVRARKNLHVVTDTRVTRVLPTTGAKGLNIRTVEVRSSASSGPVLLTASKEVILSAGAVGTPHILLNSGIGDQEDLKILNISVVLHNPSVGRNLSDHTVFGISFGLEPNAIDEGPWANLFIDPELQAQALELWQTNRTGPYVALVPVDHIGFVRVPKDSPIFDQFEDTSSGPDAVHIEMVLGAIAGSYNAGISMISPASRGTLKLQSNNPFDDPLIDPNFYDSEVDILIAREGVKAVFRYAEAPAMKNITTGVLGPLANITSEEDIDNIVRDGSMSAWHPIGTASTSPIHADWGVVDPDLLVKKVSGLRIIDASIMPYVPCAHTQTAVYLIAERASDLVKEAWK